MGGLASVLPFLAALKKQTPDMSGGDVTPDLGSDLGNAPPAPAPPPPPGPIASQPVDTLPNMATPALNPAAPEDKGNFFRQPYESKGSALVRILRSGLIGGLSGQAQEAQTYAQTGRSGGFGGGVRAGFTQALPFEKQMQALQLQHGGLTNEQLLQMLPFLRAQQFANLGKTQAETQNLTAQAGKAGAEAGAIPIKTQLEQAQALAARYKEDPGSGSLIDLQTQQPVSTSGIAPLSAQEAAVLGRQEGDRVPIKLKNQANEIVNRGIKSVSANGRQLLVDNQGNTIQDLGQATPMMTTQMRIEGQGQNREYPVLDTQNNNALQYLNANDLNTANKSTPGRYVPADQGSKALGKTALIEDIRGNIQSVRQSLQNPQMPEFTAGQRAQLAIAMNNPSPTTAISAALRGGVIGNLTPEQQDYVIHLSQLVENSMAMRSVLGAGQGSEDMRSAIRATIPNPTTPTKQFAGKQLDAFEAVLNRLSRGVPTVPLKNSPQGNQGGTQTGAFDWNAHPKIQ